MEISTDLKSWERLTYMAGTKMSVLIGKPVRYLRFKYFPQQITEIEGIASGISIPNCGLALIHNPGKK